MNKSTGFKIEFIKGSVKGVITCTAEKDGHKTYTQVKLPEDMVDNDILIGLLETAAVLQYLDKYETYVPDQTRLQPSWTD